MPGALHCLQNAKLLENTIVNAAVAVLIRGQEIAASEVLLAQRPQGKPWAGWWEFPGGKVEDGEPPLAALHRELQEELGIKVSDAYPWLTRTFAYPEKTVKLHFFMVRCWQGEPYGREGQDLSWQRPEALTVSPMLPANEPILSALGLPTVYAISNLAEMGEAEFLSALQARLKNGLRLIQVREKQLSGAQLQLLVNKVLELAQPYNARVLLNSDSPISSSAVHGVHLTAAALMALQQRPAGLSAASCHTVQELAHAQQLGLDFAVLSPVLPTRSHPGAASMGWTAFADMLVDCSIPVYAMGGLSPADMIGAWQHGAHGIAMQRAVWEQ